MAMEAVGKLRVDLVANSAKFSSGLTAAKSQLGNFSKSVRGISNSLAGMLGFGSVAMAIKGSMKELDAVGKTASKIGIGVEALQELHFAASQTGVSVGTLDMALQRMTRRVAEAAVGTGEAKAALKEMGLDAARLRDMGTGKAIYEIADAMERFSDGDKVRLAMKLFDSEGVALVNTLAGGSAALKDLADEARRLNIVIPPEAIDSITDANDAIDRLKFAVRGLVNELAVGLGPGLQIEADLLTNFVKELNNLTWDKWKEGGVSGAFGRAWNATDDQVTRNMAMRRVVNAVDKPQREDLRPYRFKTRSPEDEAKRTQQRADAMQRALQADIATVGALKESVMTAAEKFQQDVKLWEELLAMPIGFDDTTFRRLAEARLKSLLKPPELSAFQGPTAAPALQRGTQAAITAARENASRLQANTDHVAATAKHAERIKTLVEQIVNDKQIPPEIFELPP